VVVRRKETAIFLYTALIPRVLFVERRSPLGLVLVPVTGRNRPRAWAVSLL
jgi:hypothetical protein